MKKKVYFRKWVSVLLLMIDMLAVMVLASDQQETGTFIIVHLIGLAVFTIVTSLLFRFCNPKHFIKEEQNDS